MARDSREQVGDEAGGWSGRRAGLRLRGLSRSGQFVLAATLILGLTMAFVGQLVGERVQRSALQSAAESGALYMEAFLEPHVQALEHTPVLSAESVAALDQLMQSPSLKRHLASMKIWRPDGVVLYSIDKTITHRVFPQEEIAEALTGRVVAGLESLHKAENAFERGLDVPLYEIYAPLRDFDSGKVVAVGEFYENAESLQREIASMRRQVWAVVGSATLAMLALLFFMVRRGERIIRAQQAALRARVVAQARLHRRNALLQRRIARANHEFWRINELTLRRLGADLHDGPAQLLSLILLRLDELAEQFDGMAAEVPEVYDAIRRAARDALREVRDISRGLALPEIAELSLGEELALVAQRHEQRTGTQVTLALGPLPATVSLPLKLCLYRFAQEGLSNAFRHACGAGQVLAASCSNGLLHVQVRDSGPGMPGRATGADGRTRLGLAGLRYRVESLGGFFGVDSAPGAGVTLKAQFKV